MAGRRTCGSAIVQKAKKEKYKAQFIRTEKNRKRKRNKHLLKHPNDLQLLNILKRPPTGGL